MGPQYWRRDTRLSGPTLLALAICGVAAWLRVHDLGTPGLWLDEILGVRLVGPEHGPLYYGVMRATRALGDSEALIRWPFAAAGVLSVWLVYLIGLSESGPFLGLFAATLVALSPVHVYYSREARPYSLLICASLFGMLALVRLHQRSRAWRWWLFAVAVSVVLLLLASANAVFYVAGLLPAFLIVAPRRDNRPGVVLSLVVACLLAACSAWLFHALYGALASVSAHPFVPQLTTQVWPLFQPLVSGHTEQAPVTGAASAGLALIVAGAACLLWRRPVFVAMCVVIAVVGLMLPMIVLSSVGHWINVRYVLGSFPALMLLAAGVAAPLDLWYDESYARAPASGGRTGMILALCVGAGVLVVDRLQAHALSQALHDKADWRRVAAIVRERSKPGDLIVTSNDWARICLDYYLPADRAGLRIVSAGESIPAAQALLEGRPEAILVAGGFHRDDRIRRWMTSFFEIYSSSREAIRVTFYPNRETYLTDRVARTEVARDEQTLWTSLAGQIDLQRNSEPFLLNGWSPTSERDHHGTVFRWTTEPSARVYVPIVTHRPTTLTFQVQPYDGLPDRTLTIVVNGTAVVRYTLERGWNALRVDLAHAPLHTGANILELRFPAVASPAARGLPDGRLLAGAFQAFVLTSSSRS